MSGRKPEGSVRPWHRLLSPQEGGGYKPCPSALQICLTGPQIASSASECALVQGCILRGEDNSGHLCNIISISCWFKYILNPPVRIKSESPSNNRLAEWASCQSKSFVGPGQLLRWQSSLVLEVKIADCISSVPWWWCTLSTCSADGAGGPCTCMKASLSHGTRGPKDNHGAGWRWERGWSLRPRHFWQVLFLYLYPWLPWIISSTFTKANHKGRFTGPCFKYMHLTTYHSCSHLQGTDMWSRLNHAFHRDSVFLKGLQQCALWSPSTSCSIDPSILVVISMSK